MSLSLSPLLDLHRMASPYSLIASLQRQLRLTLYVQARSLVRQWVRLCHPIGYVSIFQC